VKKRLSAEKLSLSLLPQSGDAKEYKFLCEMKRYKHLCAAILSVSVLISVISSCKKEQGKDYKYFVSKEFYITYTAEYINNLIDYASSEYPAIDDLKSYISHSVNVYKVVYKTEVNSKTISASGLICVPSDKGEYPVFCFQNGTNTMDDQAPSNYPGNPAYQLIEIVASMGYVVVIPDYPGFGESADIPHPYLIKEPTVRSITDMLFAAKEMAGEELPEITIKDAVYLMGYSQGGWATLALHKALELDYTDQFNLKGSVCGAGPYDLNLLFNGMTSITTYPMPVYIGYIINAYSAYDQFDNPVSDILKEPFSSRLAGLYNGTLTFDQINSQLTTSISDLFTSDFLSGYETYPKYASVRNSLTENSITAWKTEVPLLLIHGGGDTSVNPLTTENLYNAMLEAGTSGEICKKEIIPDLDHGDAVVPAMVSGLLFINNLR
jgi:pimeloyl-ACP methyl ester carboxylesterase